MSPELKQYLYHAYQYYTTGISPRKYGYWMPHRGLCINVPAACHKELCELLIQEFGTSAAPFHDSYEHYKSEAAKPAMSKNPRRLAWLREVLGIEEGTE